MCNHCIRVTILHDVHSDSTVGEPVYARSIGWYIVFLYVVQPGQYVCKLQCRYIECSVCSGHSLVLV